MIPPGTNGIARFVGCKKPEFRTIFGNPVSYCVGGVMPPPYSFIFTIIIAQIFDKEKSLFRKNFRKKSAPADYTGYRKGRYA